MRKISFLLTAAWLWWALPLCAQTGASTAALPAPTTDSLRLKLNQVFSPIDKSQVPTSWLEEYGTPFIPLDLFNNTLTDSSRTNAQVFRFLYATLYSSRIYGGNPMPTLATVNSHLTTIGQTFPDAIPISVMRWDYATLRPDAVSANLLRMQNEQLYDVAGRTQSPYLTKTVFAAAPARNYSKSGTVSFVFHQNITFSSGAAMSLTNLYIDLGTGQGYKGVGWGTPITASYTTKGTKRIKVKFRYSTGLELQSHFDVEVLKAACPTCRYDDEIAPVPFPAVVGRHSGGNVHIRFGGNHTQLTRPLIVAEGFDASLIAPDAADAYTIEDFMTNINVNWPIGNFQTSLDISDYDIVFIDYNYGTDDIRRNAALFEDVVAWVNRTKVGGQSNVVMGLSMGGLVARYGLARMEKAQLNSSQTRLLITHDSPHRGANTPLGAQALTRQSIFNVFSLFSTGDLVPALAQSNALLDEPASQQMLILRATNADGGVATNTFLNGDYREMITFNGPQPAYPIIATSQGSQCGTGSLTPYAELVRSAGEWYLSPIPWIRRRNNKMDIIVNALPTLGQQKRISYLRVYSQRRIAAVININVNLVNKAYNSPANTLPWDGVPGGTQNIATQAGSKIPSHNISFPPFLKLSLQTQLAGDFCFVPTVSALDIADINTTTTNSTYVGGVPSASVSRMNNFIAQERFFGNDGNTFNAEHITFTARQSEWLFNEMQQAGDRTLNCDDECNPFPLISGAGSVCGTTSYSIPAQSGGVSYTWSVSANLRITSGQSTPTVTVVPNGSGTGSITLTIRRNGCTFILPAKTVQIDGPIYSQYDIYINTPNSPQTICGGRTYSLVVTGPAGTTYTWSFSGNFSGSGSGTQASMFVRAPYYYGYGSVTVNATTNCGSVSISKTFVNDASCSSSGMRLATYPNPANTSMEVSMASDAGEEALEQFLPSSELEKTSSVTQPTISGSQVIAKLYNRFSQVVWATETTQSAFRIDTSKLPADTYFLHLTQNGKTTKQQVIIAH